MGEEGNEDLTDGEIGRNGMDGCSEERGIDRWGKNEGTEEGIAIISRLRSSTFLTKKFFIVVIHCAIVIVITVLIYTCFLLCLICYSAIRLLSRKCGINLNVSRGK